MSTSTGKNRKEAGQVNISTSSGQPMNIASTTGQQQQTEKQRRKASVPHRFSVDYYGFPRITEDSDESDPNSNSDTGGGRRLDYIGDSYYYKNIFVDSMEEVRGNRGLQYLATLAANMGAFAFGTALSYPAVALPSLREDMIFKSQITEWEESWIGSIFAVKFYIAETLS